MKRGDRVLVLAAHADPLVLGGVGVRGEPAHALGPGGDLGVDLGPGRPGAQELAAVIADVSNRADRDDLPVPRRQRLRIPRAPLQRDQPAVAQYQIR